MNQRLPSTQGADPTANIPNLVIRRFVSSIKNVQLAIVVPDYWPTLAPSQLAMQQLGPVRPVDDAKQPVDRLFLEHQQRDHPRNPNKSS